MHDFARGAAAIFLVPLHPRIVESREMGLTAEPPHQTALKIGYCLVATGVPPASDRIYGSFGDETGPLGTRYRLDYHRISS
ncbi:hypothetical protein HBI56_007340 [Parastagonospora nodorum]|uniref:Uncharacterized protein n=1 Tax=Phaeosphaeria nodorum (strain SN15 / ATCC MYA-4574 / FGSC 10173) TaxID=321614 RepID=A0A7U2EQB6_PHANO|nr:hypothetical protein HBH56_122370 [Parastagonospora nodorum]QRC91045.1 hypothetical protein JI435_005500 [Parastagonospora nodorum SN15]KAH3934857.1 hypothetical protein HBH54_047920 [Parastagonospora nodorum]KAH3950203.1 hypothetical protein HBH53_076030 [Parastagonospora nodorum]KAH3986973.1 hypothetical protein HBH51_009120 [Parastagonospora nodorum]